MVDYGLAKRYVDVCRTGQHVAMREGKKLVGTAIFASLNNHMGRECSRRSGATHTDTHTHRHTPTEGWEMFVCSDDVESLGFMLTYLAMGKLPCEEDKKPKDTCVICVCGVVCRDGRSRR